MSNAGKSKNYMVYPYRLAFKQRMREIKNTVRELKEKCSDDWKKTKEDKRIKALVTEKEFFK